MGSIQDIRPQSSLRVLNWGKDVKKGRHIYNRGSYRFLQHLHQQGECPLRLDRGPIGVEEFAQMGLAIWEGKRTAPLGTWGKNKNMEPDAFPDSKEQGVILCLVDICDFLLHEGAIFCGETPFKFTRSLSSRPSGLQALTLAEAGRRTKLLWGACQ